MAKIVVRASQSSCTIVPFPTSLLKTVLPALLPVISSIVNKSLSSGVFPPTLRTALVKPIIKKALLDGNVLKKYISSMYQSFLFFLK